MKILVAEDDLTSRVLMREILAPYGEVHLVPTGPEALVYVRHELGQGAPYDLICLDIMMPEMDGQEVLKEIRELESAAGYPLGRGARVIMTTALSDKTNIMQAFREACDAYLVKPIDGAKLLGHLKSFGFLN